jgi:hypothetical protein
MTFEVLDAGFGKIVPYPNRSVVSCSDDVRFMWIRVVFDKVYASAFVRVKCEIGRGRGD